MPVDTPRYRFHNHKVTKNTVKERQKPLELALEEAVSRALRDNLAPLQRTADELHQAYADLVAACSSSRPSNALPAMLRAQTSAAALAAGLSVLSNFVAVALNPREQESDDAHAAGGSSAAVEVEDAPEHHAPAEPETEPEWAEPPEELPPSQPIHVKAPEPEKEPAPKSEPEVVAQHEPPAEVVAESPAAAESVPFNVANLSPELQDLHRRANRAAKVSMQDIKLLRPKDVKAGREHNDICHRLRSDLDKARKEYDRRFRAIQDHPVDYFYHWMVEILAEGDSKTLGEYPYPSHVLRH
jgi:hypothetical protein